MRNWRADGGGHDQAGRQTYASCRLEACATRAGGDPAPCRGRHPARGNFASSLQLCSNRRQSSQLAAGRCGSQGSDRVERVSSTPIDRSTTWPYEDGETGEFTYSRYSSPTMAEAERRLGELDGGEALLFASGSAASTSVILGLLSSGQTIALAEGAYYGTGVMLEELARWGVRQVEFDQTGPPPDGVDLIWIEAPSNPFPHDAGLRSLRGPPRTRRLRRDRCNAGAPATARARLRCRDPLCRQVPRRPRRCPCRRRRLQASQATRRDCWSSDRGPARLQAPTPPGSSCEGSARSRCVLLDRPRAQWRLPTGFGHTRPSRSYATRASAACSHSTSRTQTPRTASRRRTRTIANMTSLGGVMSRIEARARWEGARVPTGLLRLSVGLEDPAELWTDLAQALEKA